MEKKLKLNKEFVFLYAGTLSYKHDPEIFLKLSENFKDSKIIIFSKIIFGDFHVHSVSAWRPCLQVVR